MRNQAKKVNKIAAEMLAALDTFPSSLPNDYTDDDPGWTYTNLLWHAIESAKQSVRLYAKQRGDPATFRPAKRMKKIKGSVPLYLIPNPSYLDEED